MIIKDALMWGQTELKQVNIESCLIDSRVLMQGALQCGLETLLLSYQNPISESHLNMFRSYILRRKLREPIAYIVGYKEFYGRDFSVNSNVLIPRPDSETLIDAVLQNLRHKSNMVRILELGVGSGCLIVTILAEISNAIGVGVDLSQDALYVAQTNAIKYEVQNRLNLYHAHWSSFLNSYHGGNYFDIVISNPPYIDHQDNLERDVLHEPHLALFSHDRGFQSYNEIASSVARVMHNNSLLYLEIGRNMGKNVNNIFANAGFQLINTYKDIANKDRCLVFKKN